jgi:hypothetical protein
MNWDFLNTGTFKITAYYESGNKEWEREYQNGQLIETALYGRKWWHWIFELFGRVY